MTGDKSKNEKKRRRGVTGLRAGDSERSLRSPNMAVNSGAFNVN